MVASLAFMASAIATPDTIKSMSRITSFAGVGDFLAGLSHPALILLVTSVTAALLVLKNAMSAVMAYASATLGALVDSHFGELILSDMLAKPHLWHLKHNSAELFTLLTWRKHIGGGIVFMFMQTVSDLLVVCLLLSGLVFLSPGLTLGLLGTMSALGALVLMLYKPVSARMTNRYKSLESTLNRESLQVLQAVKDVKIFRLEGFFTQAFKRESDRYARCEGLLRLVLRSPSMLFEVLGFSVIFAAIVVMLYTAPDESGAMLGTLTLLTVTAWRVLNAVNRIVSSVSAIRQDLPPAAKAMAQIDAPGPSPLPGPSQPLAFAQAIALRNLSFTYPGADRPALAEVEAVIAKGTSLGLVGRSGSGKSTLADCIIGLLQPEQGAVEIDGVPLGPQNVAAWLGRVGYVGQSPCILDATLAQNIAFGVPEHEIDPDKLRRCCRMAHVDEFLQGLPQGLDTPLGESGANLSGGQRQRVAIARALYRDPDVLVLDEATSALDIQSELAFRNTVESLCGSVTLLIVAHRLSTVERCDQILWLSEGKISALGPTGPILKQYRSQMLDQCA